MQTTKYIIFIFLFSILASCEPTTVLDLDNQVEAAQGVFTYPTTQASFRVGDTLPDIPATLTDSGVFTYSVTPELPPGISINPSTGLISGIALEVTPRTTYTFRANLDVIGVEYTHDIAIEITHIPPSNFSYPSSNLDLTFEAAFTPVLPTVDGVVDSFAIDPPLPLGLSFSNITGEISGAPLVDNYEAIHFARATNLGGVATFALNVRITPQPPVTIGYSSTDYDCSAGDSCSIPAPITLPTNASNLSYNISPQLPEGYQFNPLTGEISLTFGARILSSPDTLYTVTVFNEGGSSSTSFNLETIVQPLTALNYLASVSLDKDIHTPLVLPPSVSPFFTPVNRE